ncbi:MAG TPA: BLUF domain-containing protein [Allosphingosinicella sp.]|nr:BLUF domain-containing protein [Allosphingosinicella sp.]
MPFVAKAGSKGMFQLVYISTAREPITSALLDDILDSARRNNDRDGITGLLVAGARRFLQALEGPEQAVLDTYARIKKDPRHHALVLLTGRGVEGRAFGDWAMACERGTDTESPDLRALVSELTANLSDKSLRVRLIGFAEAHGSSTKG